MQDARSSRPSLFLDRSFSMHSRFGASTTACPSAQDAGPETVTGRPLVPLGTAQVLSAHKGLPMHPY